MRTIDFTPFSRSAIGFDHLFNLLNAQTADNVDNYPPYDIVRTGEDTFRINLAVAGFAPSDINLTAQQNLLDRGRTQNSDRTGLNIFIRVFRPGPSNGGSIWPTMSKSKNATFENGLLQINLVRRVPETMKPRRIEISPAGIEPRSEKTIEQPASGLIFQWSPEAALSIEPSPLTRGGIDEGQNQRGCF